MHRIDTPTAQIDKFGQGKNGFTNGDPATGRRATDLNSDMWDAVQEEICNVIEQAGIELNKQQHDQLYQAIVEMITASVPDALLRKNDLSDVKNKKLALSNINGVDKSGDLMTGKLTLPQTSSFGVNTENVMGGDSIAIGDNDTGFKLISDGKLALMANSVQAGYFNEHELQHKDKILTQIFKAIVNNNWSAGAGGFAFQADTEAPFYATPIQRPQNDNNYFPLIKQKIVLDVGYPVTFSMGLLTTGQTTFPQIVIQAKTDTASYDRLWIFDVITGDLRIPGRMLVGDAIFTTSGDSYGSVWGNKWLSQWLSEAFASRDNRINTMATGDWVVQNFVQNVMRGSQGSMTMDGALVEAPEGCFLSGGNGNEGNQVGVALYRPLQIWRGNGWATISG